MAYVDENLNDPSLFFNPVIFTGDGTDDRAITVGFQPDLVWCRQRTDASGGYWVDSVRGNNAALQTTNVNVEGTFASMTFTSTGITVSGDENLNNEDAHNYVVWNWKAGTSFSNDASATSIGTIDSTGSASATAGFSIVSFDLTGESGVETIKHGLSTAPKVVITKRRSGGAGDWTTYTGAIGNSYVVLNKTAAGATAAEFMNNTAPTTSVFTVGDPEWWGANPFIAYCFSEVQGFSKFGSYTGNGNADGTFIYTGFRPAWIMVKKTNATHNWTILDTKRNPINDAELALEANLTNAEGSGNNMDILSNGFKFRATGEWGNGSGATYIYMAFAEAPFVNSNGVPCNAR